MFQHLTQRLRSTRSSLTGDRSSVSPSRWNEDVGEPGSLGVAAIDDPRGAMRLIAARGLVSEVTIETLVDELDGLDQGDALHLDLTDAELIDVAAVDLLEAMIDELEYRGVRVRIVGLDPHMPVLLARSGRTSTL